MTNIYVGNLPYSTTDEELHALFAPHGEIHSAKVIIDRAANRSRGFGFVEMTNDAEALAAIEALDGSNCQGRTLTVKEARPRTDKPRADRPSSDASW